MSFSHTQDITQMIASMFETAGDNIEAVSVTTEKIAARESQALVNRFEAASDWDDQLAAIQHGMGLVKGGICAYQQFVSVVPSLLPLLGSCVTNMRSTLVKYGCLFITQMAKVMGTKFAGPAESIIPVLFQPTTHGTQIIASSCRHSIEAIVRNVMSKKVIDAILQFIDSRAQIHRAVVSGCLIIIARDWKKKFVTENQKIIENALTELSQDAGFEARTKAREASKLLSERLSASTKVQTRDPEEETATEISISPVKTRIELSNELTYFTTSMRSFAENRFTMSVGEEAKFVEAVKASLSKKDTQSITEHGDTIASGFVKCVECPIDAVIVQTISAMNEVIPMIPHCFETHLEKLIALLLEKSTRSNVLSLLKTISLEYPPETVLSIGLKSPPSSALLSLAGNVVKRDKSVLSVNNIARDLLPVCCEMYDTVQDQRITSLSVGLLNNIKTVNRSVFDAFANSISENWKQILQSLHLIEPEKRERKPVRKLLAEDEAKDLNWRELEMTKYKGEMIIKMAKNHSDISISASAVLCFASLLHSAWFAESETLVLSIMEDNERRVELLETVIGALRADASSDLVDLLKIVIGKCSPKDLAPFIHVIFGAVTPMLESSDVMERKSAVMCLAELRIVIGKKLEGELEKLPDSARRIIHIYVAKLEMK